jgi:hypothetical protein
MTTIDGNLAKKALPSSNRNSWRTLEGPDDARSPRRHRAAVYITPNIFERRL